MATYRDGRCILATCNASDDNQKTAPLHGQMMATARLSYIFEYIGKSGEILSSMPQHGASDIP